MANPTIRIKRSSTPNKVPGTDQLLLGELAINTFDGKLYLEQDQTSASGITTVVSVNPWNVGVGTLAYDINFTAGSVGIGTTNTLAIVTSSNTAVLAAGIVTAFKYFGDGSGLTGTGRVTASESAPGSPIAGDLWWKTDVGELFIYYSDGTSDQWVETSGGSETVTISDSAPSSPNSGDLWWDSDDGVLNIYYDDGGSAQWIDATGALSSGLLFWKSTSAGIHTLGNVGIATTNPRYSLEVGPVGYADTALWVNGDARVTGILSVGQGTVTIDGSENEIIVGTGITIHHTNGITVGNNAVHSTGITITSLRVGETEIINSNGQWTGSSSGITGAQGAAGAQGQIGNTGAQGTAGAQGAQGFQGVGGATGAQGQIGNTGAQGSPGAAGAQGSPGAAGAQGSPGAAGAQGSPGAAGAQGSPGSTGAQGATGPTGGSSGQVLYNSGGTATSSSALTFSGSSLGINDGGAANNTTAFTSYKRLLFDNTFNDTARGPNKITMYNDSSSWMGGFGIHNNNVSYYSGGNHTWYKTNSTTSFTQVLSLNSSGDLTASGSVTSNSDISLKTNITTISNALEKVCKLRGVEFDYIESGEHNIGVIAQEVEEVLPELVIGDDPKSVAYGNLTAVLIEAIKELKNEVSSLKQEINTLKGNT